MTKSLKGKGRYTNVPYASSWLERLRSIKRLRRKIVEGQRSAGESTTGSGGMTGDQHNMQQHSGGVGAVCPQALTRKYQMDDFTAYTQ